MANTYQLISSVTVGSGGASSIEFTSIPATYTDLCLKLSIRSAVADITDYVLMTVSSSTSYSSRLLYGNGSTATSSTWGSSTNTTLGIINAANNTASTFSNVETYIPNYLASQNKSLSSDCTQEGNTATNIYATLTAGLSSNTAAISSITLVTNSGSNFAQYSTAYLYGIKNS